MSTKQPQKQTSLASRNARRRQKRLLAKQKNKSGRPDMLSFPLSKGRAKLGQLNLRHLDESPRSYPYMTKELKKFKHNPIDEECTMATLNTNLGGGDSITSPVSAHQKETLTIGNSMVSNFGLRGAFGEDGNKPAALNFTTGRKLLGLKKLNNSTLSLVEKIKKRKKRKGMAGNKKKGQKIMDRVFSTFKSPEAKRMGADSLSSLDGDSQDQFRRSQSGDLELNFSTIKNIRDLERIDTKRKVMNFGHQDDETSSLRFRTPDENATTRDPVKAKEVTISEFRPSSPSYSQPAIITKPIKKTVITRFARHADKPSDKPKNPHKEAVHNPTEQYQKFKKSEEKKAEITKKTDLLIQKVKLEARLKSKSNKIKKELEGLPGLNLSPKLEEYKNLIKGPVFILNSKSALLLKGFNKVDHLMDIINNASRTNTVFLNEISTRMLNTYSIKFGRSQLRQVLHLDKQAYQVFWDYFEREKEYDLMLKIPRDENVSGVSQSRHQMNLMAGELIRQRKTAMREFMVDYIYAFHQKFLEKKGLDKQYDTQAEQCWHKDFDVEEMVDEIPFADLPAKPKKALKVKTVNSLEQSEASKKYKNRKINQMIERVQQYSRKKDDLRGLSSRNGLNQTSQKGIKN